MDTPGGDVVAGGGPSSAPWRANHVLIGREVCSAATGEVRRVSAKCRASVGSISNPDHMNISLGKAGRKRWLGRKPHNRGTSMNPVSHPMGGGEGRTAGGRHPCSPTGVLAKGGKTRKKHKPSNSSIIRRRRPGPHYA